MINVSNEFQQLMSKRTDFKQNAEITFANGEVLTLTEEDFTLSNNMVTDAGESNGIPLGVAVCRNIQIELMNDDDRFSDYDFFGAKIRLFLTFQLSETVERIEYGTFTVLTPETYGITVIITALDDMYKADAAYNTTLVYPATLGEILRDACNLADISQGDTTFLNDDFVVQSKPEDITIRQLFGYVSMIAGGNARIDRTGRLRIVSYDFDVLESIRNNIDGGSFNPWKSNADLDGGDFTYNVGDVADGGSFTDSINYHILTMWSDLKVDTDDIVITGIKAEYTNADNEEMTAEYGVSGYVLQVENPLFVGNEQTAIDLIGNVMVGGRFRQFSGDIVANPTIEFMDVVSVIDRKNNVYVSFVTDINFEFFGFTSIKNSAEPALRNSAKTYSEATKTLVSARKLVKNERSARERAVEQLANDLSKSSGLFMTQEKQSDGSIIYYMHDKATLAESMIIWKLTALAFGISTDGGKTYPYGFTVNGETITRLLYAEGIDADYIDTGTMSADRIRGGELVLGGENNVDGVIKMYDADGNQVGGWNNDNFFAQSANYVPPRFPNDITFELITNKVGEIFFYKTPVYANPLIINMVDGGTHILTITCIDGNSSGTEQNGYTSSEVSVTVNGTSGTITKENLPYEFNYISRIRVNNTQILSVTTENVEVRTNPSTQGIGNNLSFSDGELKIGNITLADRIYVGNKALSSAEIIGRTTISSVQANSSATSSVYIELDEAKKYSFIQLTIIDVITRIDLAIVPFSSINPYEKIQSVIGALPMYEKDMTLGAKVTASISQSIQNNVKYIKFTFTQFAGSLSSNEQNAYIIGIV